MSAWPCALILGVVLVTGCATVPSAPQSIHNFVQTVPQASGLRIVIAANSRGPVAGYSPTTRVMRLDPSLLQADYLWPAVAHEVAHDVLRHTEATCPPHRRPACEQEANALGVHLLVRGLGMAELEAMTRMYELLRAALHSDQTDWPGHAPPCDEIRDLLGRFPQHRAHWQDWACAPHEATSSQDQDPASR